MNDVPLDKRHLPPEEIALRRYEAIIGLWKVVLGTFVIGLAGVAIPGAINWASTGAEITRKADELKLRKLTSHEQFIKDFFQTAVNQDIELRIRFANYFVHLSEDREQKSLWVPYLKDLEQQKDEGRKRITRLEKQLVDLKISGKDKTDPGMYDQTSRELTWAYGEIGYLPRDRSVVTQSSGKKERLYKEVTEIIEKLLVAEVIEEKSAAYTRFWELYNKDLRGVESVDVARAMVSFGQELNNLIGKKPSEELRKFSRDLLAVTRQETSQ